MVVMPLGPDYARPLNIDITELGLTAAAYTISAAFSGGTGYPLFKNY